MTIKKLNEETVVCILTTEDLGKKGLSAKDFSTPNREALTLVERLAKQVSIKYFDCSKSFRLQVCENIQTGCVAIEITVVSEDEVEDFKQNAAGTVVCDEEEDFTDEPMVSTLNKGMVNTFILSNLKECIQLSKVISRLFLGTSNLVKIKENEYAIILHYKNQDEIVGYKMQLIASEYCASKNIQHSNSIRLAYLEEHGDLIISQNALSYLAKL